MSELQTKYFDQAAATWDDNPVRVTLMKAVAGAIIHHVQPTPQILANSATRNFKTGDSGYGRSPSRAA